MSSPTWYVHFQGETLGPLSPEKLVQMLAQNRLQFVDFAWTSGYTKWIRINEIDEFAAHLPAYPKGGIPAEEPEPKARKTKAAEAAPQPKQEAAPEPAREPVQKTATRFLRIPLSGKVLTEDHGNFEVLNIAERGVFVRAKKLLEIGTEIQFRLEAAALGEPLQMRGVVIRHALEQDEPGFAIEFTRLNPVHKAVIEQYVRKHSE